MILLDPFYPCGPQRRQQALFKIGNIKIHIMRGDGSPVLTAHGAVDDKSQTQAFPIKASQT
jgi:hypothetical protein